jgi:hypothetical protein
MTHILREQVLCLRNVWASYLRTPMHTLTRASLSITIASLIASSFFACGGSKTVATPTSVADSAPDVKTEAAPPGPKCSDASIDELSIPDASVGDSGANTGACFACLKTNCKSELVACNDNCDCRGAVTNFLTCSASMPQGAQMCAIRAFGAVSGEARQLGSNVGTCALTSCQSQCVPPGFLDAGSDASSDDAGDGGDAGI